MSRVEPSAAAREARKVSDEVRASSRKERDAQEGPALSAGKRERSQSERLSAFAGRKEERADPIKFNRTKPAPRFESFSCIDAVSGRARPMTGKMPVAQRKMAK